MTDAMRSEFEAEYPLPENAAFNGDVYVAPLPAEGMTAYSVQWDAWKRAWQAAQSVPVVGEPVAYLKADVDGKVLWSEDCVCEDAVWPGEDSEFGEYSLPVYRRPTHSIPAAELATLREKAAEADELRKDAEREAACFEAAIKATYGMVDIHTPHGQPGSYVRGEYDGIIAALKELRKNFDAAIAQEQGK